MNLRQELKNNMVDYDLNDPVQRKVIEDFEKELAGRDFNEYCVYKGYYTKHETKKINNAGLEYLVTEYRFISDKIKELADTKSKIVTLERFRTSLLK